MDIKVKRTNGTNRKSLKGFTLVELIVVIAIIAILAGVINLATQGFLRNAKLETLNDNARLAYTGFQNIVTQCEIKQDNGIFWRNISTDGSYTADDIRAAVVYFHIAQNGNGNKYDKQRIGDRILIVNVWKDGNAAHGNDFVRGTDAYERVANVISGYIPDIMEGSYAVYVDMENYTVDSVVCRSIVNRTDTPIMEDADLVRYDRSGGYRFYGLDNPDQQKALYTNIGSSYGVYPYQDDLK